MRRSTACSFRAQTQSRHASTRQYRLLAYRSARELGIGLSKIAACQDGLISDPIWRLKEPLNNPRIMAHWAH